MLLTCLLVLCLFRTYLMVTLSIKMMLWFSVSSIFLYLDVSIKPPLLYICTWKDFGLLERVKLSRLWKTAASIKEVFFSWMGRKNIYSKLTSWDLPNHRQITGHLPTGYYTCIRERFYNTCLPHDPTEEDTAMKP